ncbi:MAG: glycosyltransferase family protein [Actinomycetota bacterium]
MSTAVIAQARMGSSRLPGKTLEPLGDGTVLDWVVARAAAGELVDEVLIATSRDPLDDPIEARCAALGVQCVRGEPLDVLARYGAALHVTDAGEIVRITADCPLVDPSIVDLAISSRRDQDLDYVSTSLDGRFPRGLDVEVVRRSVLEVAEREAVDADEREHVTLFVYRRPERFSCGPVVAPSWARHPELRITVDEAPDLEVVRRVVDGLGPDPLGFGADDVVRFLSAHPDIVAINRDVHHRHVT